MFGRIEAPTPLDVSATVPAQLALSLGPPASFGAFTPGVGEGLQRAPRRANVISTAGDATLSVADPSSTATGHLVNGTFSLPSALKANATARRHRRRARRVGGSANPTTLLTYPRRSATTR